MGEGQDPIEEWDPDRVLAACRRAWSVRTAGGSGPDASPRGRSGLGRFVGLREIGRGGMGAVFEALDVDLRRQVAIKRLDDERSDSPHWRERFLREARIGGQLEHPNIVPVYGLDFDASGSAYFAMRLVRGTNLSERLQAIREDPSAPPYPLSRRLADFLKVCDAISFAHSKGVIHRDLKPSNILLGDFGEVLVVDWGVAKRLDSSEGPAGAAPSAGIGAEDTTRTGSVLGTLRYMSPEQARGDVRAIDERADVHALGVTLGELVRAWPDRPGDVPPELETAIRKATANRKEDRYPNVRALQADVEAFLDDRTLAAFQYATWQRVLKWVRRNRAVSAVSTVAAVLLAVFVAWLLVALGQSRTNAERAEEERGRTSAALEEILALSEAAPLNDLFAAERLNAAWRGYPDRVEGLEEWIASARRFEGRRSHHEDRIREIEARGADREAVSWEVENRRRLVETLIRLESTLLEAERAVVRGRDLQALAATPEHREAWERAEDEGLEMPRAAGLLPIGKDAPSGLWEFWVVPSGTRPPRGPDGRLEIGPESGVVLVLLPGGSFRMGADGSRLLDERPAREVTVPPFLLSKYEMTRGQWNRACGADSGDARPVEQASWTSSRWALVVWGLRLPSEAEWEYAARGGTTDEWWTRDLATAGNLADRQARAAGLDQGEDWDDGAGPPCLVGSYRANPFGLHDTIGNVAEWCEDTYGEDYAGAPVDGSPRVDPASPLRVYRGGGCASAASGARSAKRYRAEPSFRANALGVRPAMSLPVR